MGEREREREREREIESSMLLSLAYREHENEKDEWRKWIFSFQVRFLEKAMLSRSLEINKLVTTSRTTTRHSLSKSVDRPRLPGFNLG